MKRIYQFAGDHPAWFALLVLTVWLVTGGIAVAFFSLIFNVPLSSMTAQSLGTIASTTFILLIKWRFGWLRPAGIIRIGSWKAWLATLAGVIYLVAVYSYVFFGDISFDFSSIRSIDGAGSLIGRQLVVASVEEILFRGVILYALIRVWGKSKGGMVAAVLFSSLLFGLSHLLQVFAGGSFSSALIVSLENFVSAIWWAALVLMWTSVWPAAAVHAVSNLSVLIRLLTMPGKELSDSSYLLAVAFQLPLVIILLWVLLRSHPHPAFPESPHFVND